MVSESGQIYGASPRFFQPLVVDGMLPKICLLDFLLGDAEHLPEALEKMERFLPVLRRLNLRDFPEQLPKLGDDILPPDRLHLDLRRVHSQL